MQAETLSRPVVSISHLGEHLGEVVVIKGWLYNIRSSGKLMFPEIRDGSGIVQGVVSKKDVSEQVWETCERLTQESSIIVNRGGQPPSEVARYLRATNPRP
ncbi:MAG: OB-fold nucleic acid binding domain-containing protein [Chloroherpetonaceae bacterium]|nr:OB-fold nucleic acid binding domain-containing protein [Chloroherpetonaceae bacterium]